MANACMSRLASGVMSTQHMPVQRTHRTSFSVEARQILRMWGRFQLEHQRLLKVTYSQKELLQCFWQCTWLDVLYLTKACTAEK